MSDKLINSVVIPDGTSCFIWDLDGTLLDSYPIHVELVSKVLASHGLPIPSERDMAHHFHGRLEDSLRGLSGDVSEAKFQKIMRDFLELDNAYVLNVDDHLHPDAVDLAKRAHQANIRQILVTNRAHGVDRGMASPRNMVQHSQLAGLIDTVICGDEVEKRKPDSEVLKSAGDIDFSRAVVIGDQFVDGEFAHNLGALAVLVNRSNDPIAHIDQLTQEMHENLTIVDSLYRVKLR